MTDFVVVNDTVAFNITVINKGSSDLHNVTVTESYIPAELTYKDHSDKDIWFKSGNVFTYQGILAKGGNSTFTIWFTANTNGTLVNRGYSGVLIKYLLSVHDVYSCPWGREALGGKVVDAAFGLNLNIGGGDFCYLCRDGTDAGETEVDILTASFVDALDSDDVGVIGREGIQSFLTDGNVLVIGKISGLLKSNYSVKVNGYVFVVVDSSRQGLNLLRRKSCQVQMIADADGRSSPCGVYDASGRIAAAKACQTFFP